MTVEELELMLMKRLIGVTLVTEIGLTRDLMRQLEGAIREVRRHSRSDWFSTLVEDFPCIYLTYVVAFGVYEYQRGELWSRMPLDFPQQTRGLGFVNALESICLETFDSLIEMEHAQTYLPRILIHGGIPNYCLSDFFWALAKAVRRGATDAADVLAYWRNTPSVLGFVDRPVQRFLWNGGAVSRDLVDRCLELLEEDAVGGQAPDAGRLGLPSYVVEGFVSCRTELAEELRGRQIVETPRPRLLIDPWLPSGPFVELPALSGLMHDSYWVVRADDSVTRVVGTTLDNQRVLVKPARSWDVDFEEGGKRVNTFHVGGLERAPVLVFDPSTGRLSRDSSQVRTESVWLGAPKTMSCDGREAGSGKRKLHVVEEFPDLEGTWEGWRVRHIALDGVSSIEYQMQGGVSGSVQVFRSSRPTLNGSPVSGIVGNDGRPVYAVVPKLCLPAADTIPASRWTVRIEAAGHDVVRQGDQLTEADGALDLQSLLPGVFGEVHLRVHGPLGSDLRERFLVIPDLEVRRPPGILGKGATAETVVVRAGTGVQVAGMPPGGVAHLPIPDDLDEFPVIFVGPGRQPCHCRIQISRLIWELTREAGLGSRLGTQPVTVTTSDLRTGAVRFLFVRTRRPDLQLRLTLEARLQLLQVLEATTHGEEGRAVFDLQRLADTAAASGSGHLRIFLELGLVRCEIGSVVSPLGFGKVSVEELIVGQHAHVTLEIDGLTNQSNRVLRLWPVARPWEPPVVEHLADGPVTAVEIVREDGSIAPGKYLMELLVEDGWLPLPDRPDFSAPGARVLRIGSDEQARTRLKELGEAEPLAVLEWTAELGELPRPLVGAELAPVMPQAVRTVLALAEERHRSVEFTSLLTICRSLAETPDALALEIGRYGGAEMTDPLPLRRITLCLASTPQVREGGVIDDEILQQLWVTFPPLAALLEIPRMRESPAGLARCERYLADRDPKGQWQAPVGEPPTPAHLAISLDQLVAMEKELKLVPEKILAMDTHVLGVLEWLRKCRGNPHATDIWVDSARVYATDQELLLPSLSKRLDERYPQDRGHQLGCWLPYVSLAACLHVVLCSPRASAAAKSLDKLLTTAGSLVMRDLVLARFLVATTTNSQAEATGA